MEQCTIFNHYDCVMYNQDTNLIFTKKVPPEDSPEVVTERMTILVSAAVLDGIFLPPIRDSSYSGDSSSHIEKMRSTLRERERERESN